MLLQPSGINHFLFSVSDLERSFVFYRDVLGAKPLVRGRKLAYFDWNGYWLALNEEVDIPRQEIHQSYTHLAFSIAEETFDSWLEHLQKTRSPSCLAGNATCVTSALFTLPILMDTNSNCIQVHSRIGLDIIGKKRII